MHPEVFPGAFGGFLPGAFLGLMIAEDDETGFIVGGLAGVAVYALVANWILSMASQQQAAALAYSPQVTTH